VLNRDPISGATGTVRSEDTRPGSGASKFNRLASSGKIHRVYFVLAAIDVVVMIASLSLAHHGNALLFGTVQSTLTRNTLLEKIDEFRTIAGRVSAPGNDVFQSRDPDTELGILENAVADARQHADILLKGFSVVDEEWLLAQQRVYVGKIDNLIVSLGLQVRSVLDAYRKGDLSGAMVRAARLNQQLRYIHFTVGKAAEAMRKAEASEKVSRLQVSQSMSHIELLLAGIVLLVVGGVTIYGSRLARLLQAQSDELASFNTELETRVAERTAELAAASERTQALNAELAHKVDELKDAQAEMIRKDELIRQSARFDAALQHMPIGMSWFDADRRLVTCNRAYLRVYGFDERMAEPGRTLEDHFTAIKGLVAQGGSPLRASYLADALAQHHMEMDGNSRWTSESELSDQKIVRMTSGPIPDGGWILIHEDITDERQRAARIAHMAGHDVLTDLPNRMLLRQCAEAALRDLDKLGHISIHHLNLDRFNDVNSMLGHSVGDEVIRQVADRLLGCAGSTDTVARIGGDEFVVLQTTARAADDAPLLATRILDTIKAPFDIGGRQIKIEGSLGYAVAPEDGTEADTLFRHADVALRFAKCEGRGHWKAFEPGMEEHLSQRRNIERDLSEAIDNGELEVHYQPIIDAKTRRLSGAEALVRWRHPVRGLVPPGEFIPIAEESGLIGDLGAWVLKTACAQAAKWPRGMRIGVNLSPIQFQKGELNKLVRDTLAETGLAPGALELELTETALLVDSEQTVGVLQQIRAQGVRIALDDFGTGYSSLAYLRRFPFDKIKIDRCFVADLAADRTDALAFVRAICALGHALDLTITVEGVETEQQLAAVTEEGCTEIQGFYFSPPVPAEDFDRLLLAFGGPAPMLSSGPARERRRGGPGTPKGFKRTPFPVP
jgi:diguanylate cyclase (GGDEF)-like protein